MTDKWYNDDLDRDFHRIEQAILLRSAMLQDAMDEAEASKDSGTSLDWRWEF